MKICSVAPALSLACLSMTVAGCPVHPEAYRPVDVAPNALLADRPGGTVFLADHNGPNPVGVQGIRTRADRYIPRHFADVAGDCKGFVARAPALTVEADSGLADAEVRVEGQAEILMIEGPQATHCLMGDDAKHVTFADSQPGRYRFYAGHREYHARFEYSLIFEDMTQAITLPWRDDEEIIHVDAPGQDQPLIQESLPLSRQGQHQTAAITPDSACLPDGFVAAHQPSARMTIEEANDYGLSILSDQDLRVLLVGPVSDDSRDLPTQCLSPHTGPRPWAAGEYFVFPALAGDERPDMMELITYTPEGDADPAYLATEPAADLPVAQRSLTKHYPLLTAPRIWSSDNLRQRLSAEAPQELLVGLNADAENARIFLPHSQLSPQPQWAPRSGERPRAFEVGLVIATGDALFDDGAGGDDGSDQERPPQALFLSADGLIYSLDADLLVAAEDLDEVTIPDDPRSERLLRDQALLLATSDDRELAAQYQELTDDYDRCIDGFYDAYQDEFNALRDDGENAEFRRHALIDVLEPQARQECDDDQVQQQIAQITESLKNARMTRRQQALGQQRQRLIELFDK